MPPIHGNWDYGVLFISGILVLAIIVTIIIGIFFISTDAGNRGKDFLWWVGTLIVEAGFLAWVLFPFQVAYLKYEPMGGTVAAVNSRFVTNSSGNGSSQKYAIELTNGTVLGCLDTRCSLLKPGDKVILKCERQWQFSGTPGYDCNWGASETPKGLVTP